MGSYLITGGTVVTATDTVTADVLVDGERIAAILAPDSVLVARLRREGVPVLSADGCYVLPGGVDPHTHFEAEGQAVPVLDTFATGTIDGCIVTYDSVVWTELRDAGNIQWTLTGEATAQRGDGACGLANDWIGTETFTVLSSEDPAVSPGCEYTLNVSGTYIGEVE